MHAFNPATRTWTPIQYTPGGPAPAPRALHTMTAISETTLVLFGGDSGSPGYPTSLNDTWTFDLQARTWRCVSEIAEDAAVPLARSSHTAVYGELPPPHGPAIYVYGGVGSNRGAVFRLRTATWTWELLSIAVDPEHKTALPVEREQHAAVWWPSVNSMVVVGGDGSVALLGDVWQLKPNDLKAEDCHWLWRRMMIAIGGNASMNRIVPCAAHSLFPLEADKSQLILWGGLCGEGVGLAPTNSGILINLEKSVSERFDIAGPCPTAGRVMHTLVSYRKLDEHFVFLFGGCGLTGTVETTSHLARITAATRQSGAVEFGATNVEKLPSNEVIAGENEVVPIIANKTWLSRETLLEHDTACDMFSTEHPRQIPVPVKRKAVNGEMADGEESVPLLNSGEGRNMAKLRGQVDERYGVSPPDPALEMHMPMIPSGTPLSGRILDSTEVGHFVSVIIKGKEFKGVLVTRPTTRKGRRPETPSREDESADPAGAVSDAAPKSADVAPRESGTSGPSESADAVREVKSSAGRKSAEPFLSDMVAATTKQSSDVRIASDTDPGTVDPGERSQGALDSSPVEASGKEGGKEGESMSKVTAELGKPVEESRGEGSNRDEEDGLEEVVASGHVPSKRPRLYLTPKSDPDVFTRVVPFLPNPREDNADHPSETEVIAID
jgi:hypothetical protein